MATPGTLNTLRVISSGAAGVSLDGGELGEILLPRSEAPRTCRPGESLEVFVLYGSKGRLIASTSIPHAMVGDFALLRVAEVTAVGAFLDWGLPKDLLVPFGEQQVKMEPGSSYLVRIYRDEHTGRIVASSRLDRFMDRRPHDFRDGQAVDLLICNRTDLGYKAIVNKAHWGLLHAGDVFQRLSRGQHLPGFIKKVRRDGKIDLSLHTPGYEKIDAIAAGILAALDARGGFISVTDSSPPETIQALFGISKKSYKKAVGALYRQRRIAIEPGGIRLTAAPNKHR